MVGISKMMSIFILGYPQPPQGRPRGGAWGARGGIPPKIKWYVNFGVFNSGDFKNDVYFHFKVTPTPARAPPGGGLGAPEGVYHQKSSDMSILGFSMVGISKMMSIFILGYPQPPQGRPRGGAWGARGGIPPKIKWYVNFGVFNSGDFKNDLYFHFRVPQTPKRAPPGGLGGPEGV